MTEKAGGTANRADLDAARIQIDKSLQSVEQTLLAALGEQAGQPPELLYHYTNSMGLLGILSSNRLWASDILYMNDSTEVEYARSMIVSEAASLARTTSCEVAKTLCERMDGVLYPVHLVGGFYAACFCEEGDLLSQWRGYAGSVGGYSIGLAVKWLGQRWGEKTIEQQFQLRKVIYDQERQKAVITDYLRNVIETLEKLTGEPLGEEHVQLIRAMAHGVIQRDMLECMLTMKNPLFREEKEWRLIHHRPIIGGAAAEKDIQYRSASSFIVPYVLLDVTPMAGVYHNIVPVTRVIVGPTAHPLLASRSVLQLVRHLIPFAEVENSRIPMRA